MKGKVDMTAFDRLKKLCDEQGLSVNKLEEKIGLSKNTLYSWKKNTPKGSNLTKVADFFDVSTDYLLGRTDKKRYYDLTEQDEKEVEEELERILKNSESNFGFAAFDGEVPDESDKEDYEMFVSAMRVAIRSHKRMAKKKFTPKKYR